MVPEETKSNRAAPNIEARYKISAGTGANVKPFSCLKRLCLVITDSIGKALEKFDAEWSILMTYRDSTIKQFEVREGKGI